MAGNSIYRIDENLSNKKDAALSIVNKLNANVYAYDRLCTKKDAEEFNVGFTKSFKNMDCILILTDHKEFHNLSVGKSAGR